MTKKKKPIHEMTLDEYRKSVFTWFKKDIADKLRQRIKNVPKL